MTESDTGDTIGRAKSYFQAAFRRTGMISEIHTCVTHLSFWDVNETGASMKLHDGRTNASLSIAVSVDMGVPDAQVLVEIGELEIEHRFRLVDDALNFVYRFRGELGNFAQPVDVSDE